MRRYAQTRYDPFLSVMIALKAKSPDYPVPSPKSGGRKYER